MRITPSLSSDEHADPNAGPADIAAAGDRGANVWSTARRHLSTDQFNALWLYYVEGMEMPDLARGPEPNAMDNQSAAASSKATIEAVPAE